MDRAVFSPMASKSPNGQHRRTQCQEQAFRLDLDYNAYTAILSGKLKPAAFRYQFFNAAALDTLSAMPIWNLLDDQRQAEIGGNVSLPMFGYQQDCYLGLSQHMESVENDDFYSVHCKSCAQLFSKANKNGILYIKRFQEGFGITQTVIANVIDQPIKDEPCILGRLLASCYVNGTKHFTNVCHTWPTLVNPHILALHKAAVADNRSDCPMQLPLTPLDGWYCEMAFGVSLATNLAFHFLMLQKEAETANWFWSENAQEVFQHLLYTYRDFIVTCPLVFWRTAVLLQIFYEINDCYARDYSDYGPTKQVVSAAQLEQELIWVKKDAEVQFLELLVLHMWDNNFLQTPKESYLLDVDQIKSLTIGMDISSFVNGLIRQKPTNESSKHKRTVLSLQREQAPCSTRDTLKKFCAINTKQFNELLPYPFLRCICDKTVIPQITRSAEKEKAKREKAEKEKAEKQQEVDQNSTKQKTKKRSTSNPTCMEKIFFKIHKTLYPDGFLDYNYANTNLPDIWSSP